LSEFESEGGKVDGIGQDNYHVVDTALSRRREQFPYETVPLCFPLVLHVGPEGQASHRLQPGDGQSVRGQQRHLRVLHAQDDRKLRSCVAASSDL
jgi:hypothetical protein